MNLYLDPDSDASAYSILVYVILHAIKIKCAVVVDCGGMWECGRILCYCDTFLTI